MRRKFEETWLRLVRLYTFNTPISKGKYRLSQIALKLCKLRHESMPARAKDGRPLSANLTTGMQDLVFFLGEYEKAFSRITGLLIDGGDVCIDAGANFGWYTTLMALHCGEAGQVHAFEPVPQSFAELKKSYDIMGSPGHVFINNLALGDDDGTVSINVFDGEPSGHASMAAKRVSNASSFECTVTTLDRYLTENNVGEVNFVKADIEGAELMFLHGAERLFDQNRPPIFLIEMALEQSRHFGYLPNDLIEFIAARGDYQFFAADESKGTVRRILAFSDDDIGANVFCLPGHVSLERISQFLGR